MSRTLAQLDLFGGPPTPVIEGGRRGAAVQPITPPPALLQLAEALPESIHLGTSSWSFPGWAGLVYDQPQSVERLARGGLEAYAHHPLFRTVGIDRSYYAPLRSDELEAYAAAVGPGFRFLMKAHEAVTTAFYPRHARYGHRRGLPSELFLDPAHATIQIVEPFVRAMGEHAGPILFQLPPQDVGGLGGPRHFAERLHRFLRALPRGPLYAVEVRNAELVTPDYADALTDVGACHCVNVYPGMPPPAIQRARAATDRGPALVIRWMLRPDLTYEQARALFHPFDRMVEEDRFHRHALAELIVDAVGRGVPSFVIANNKAEGSSPLTLFRLAEAVVARLAGRRPPGPLA
ncbi:MAG: DUF72 domain-containing protein [Myxococcales bacterium]|nr:DUF72 domain-containing protein [Myxococcales bacterium]MCB9700437.1 DUF72 domain-containing protein [Myxococcales bacterium]